MSIILITVPFLSSPSSSSLLFFNDDNDGNDDEVARRVPHPPALGNRARNCSCNNQRPGLGVDSFFFKGKLRFLIAKNRLLVAILVDIFRVFLC